MDKRFFCHEGLLKRVFTIMDSNSLHKGEITFRQFAHGLKFMSTKHPTAATEAEAGCSDFLKVLTKLLDLDGHGMVFTPLPLSNTEQHSNQYPK